MKNNARGSIWVSSAATGGENGLKIRVYGNKGSVEWFQDDPNHLKFIELGKPAKIITRASNVVSDLSLQSSRLAAGHPEGFFEAFANIYRAAFDDMAKNNATGFNPGINSLYPNVYDGLEGVRFIERVQASSDSDNRWLDF